MTEVNRQKRHYSKPSLQRLGSVAALTASGTKMADENGRGVMA
jgi:hypothetical protein